MTKSEYDKLEPCDICAMRYQYLGREKKQTGFKGFNPKHDGKVFVLNKWVSYKSVDLIK